MTRGDEVEARVPGQGRLDPVRMEDEVERCGQGVGTRFASVEPHTHDIVDRQEIGVDAPDRGTPRSVQDCGVESSDTEAHEPPGDMPLGVAMAVQDQPLGPHYGRFAVLAEDDTDNGEAPTISQEPRPARRLVLVGGRSGRGGVEARHPERDPFVHVDADADSAVSDGGPDSVAGVSSASEAEKIKVPVVVRVPPVRPSVAAQRSGFGQIDHWDISEVFSCRAVMQFPGSCGDLFGSL